MPLPLYVDLDGTLVATDTLWESLLLFLRRSPLESWRLLGWVWQGKARCKERLANAITIDVKSLPYRQEVLALLEARRQSGGKIILATAAHKQIAERVAQYLGGFEAVLATEKAVNLSGPHKARAIQTHAQGAFAYIGDQEVDIPVWQQAQECLVVSSSIEYLRLTKAIGKPFAAHIQKTESNNRWKVLGRALRLHQWTKNSLLVVPLILAHQFSRGYAWQRAVIGFFAFSLTASSIYLLNDLLDLDADRHHPRKRFRPLASGALSIPTGLALSFLCFVLGVGGGWVFISPLFAGLLLGYVVTTLLYSFVLKRIPIIDVLALAFFYVYRLVVGAVATGVILTPWLLAFAAFLFVSLGCLKRVGELTLWRNTKTDQLARNGRGYVADDLSMLALFGVNAGFLSLLVLALYINSAEVIALYQFPWLLWGVVIALLYWLMRVWLLTWRGTMHDDPVLFALEDKASRWVGVLIAICILLAI